MKKRLLVLGLKLLWGLALVIVVAWYGDIGESWKAIETARPAPLVLATLLGVLSVFLGAVGVTLLGRAVDERLRWMPGIRGFCIAWVLGFFLGRVSEFSLPWFWRRDLPVPQGAAVVLVDKLVSLIWFTVLGAVGLGLLVDPRAGLLAGAFGVVVLGGIFFVTLSDSAPRLAGKLLPSDWVDRLQDLPATFRLVTQRRRGAVVANVIITGLRAALHGAILVALMAAIGQTLDPIIGTAIQAMVTLTSLIPGSLMGLGYWESVYVMGLGRAGIGTADALAAALIWRALNLLIMPPIFLFGWSQWAGGANRTEQRSA
ncbi:MAG: lysylphosphatidylglycerol synthase transmembrane domain-containing protein [Polyangiales bacterium]